MNKIRFGVIGCGHIGKRHAEMVMRQEGAELVAMCDVRSKEACDVSYEVSFYHDPLKMMQEENLDVICVCTPNGLHAEHSLLALRNGKHVVVEKPMALTKADCEEIVFVIPSLREKNYKNYLEPKIEAYGYRAISPNWAWHLRTHDEK